nr:winged helix-turn-helix domain-containing protein [Candidatus Njordarchaeota archaeon]
MLVDPEGLLTKRRMSVPVEEILSSKGRIKIIKILLKNCELSISEIVRLTRLNHNSVEQHLDLLKHAGLICEKNFGRIRIYSIRNESLVAKAIRSFVSLWDPTRTEINK